MEAILKALGPLALPMLQGMINQYWPSLDTAIATIPNADEKALFQALSPVLKSFILSEVQKYLVA